MSVLPSLDSISIRRRALGLTQTQLAEMAKVSQSYIAKLEAKKIEPSYNKVKAIFEALDQLEKKREIKVKEIMTSGIVSVKTDDIVKKAVKLMSEYGYSQLPVLEGNFSVGSITEKILIDIIITEENQNSIKDNKISEIMEKPFPQVGDEAPVSLVASMLKYYPAILIQQSGKLTGIVTKADLLKTLS